MLINEYVYYNVRMLRSQRSLQRSFLFSVGFFFYLNMLQS